MVGGGGLDVEGYSVACERIGIKTGMAKYIKNPKIRSESGMSVLVESGAPGTFGDGYFVWQSETVGYAVDEIEFLQKSCLAMGSKYSQLWMDEEERMIEFLAPFKQGMPSVANYCAGDFFVIFKVIYACSEEGGCICSGYSNQLIKILAEIGAGIESDCEPYQVHFSRIRGLKGRDEVIS